VDLTSIPKRYQRQAQALLNELRKQNAVGWNDKMELIRGTDTLRGTNVVDLARHALSKSKGAKHTRPNGFYALRPVLLDRNVPTSLINNAAWLQSTPSKHYGPIESSTPPATPLKPRSPSSSRVLRDRDWGSMKTSSRQAKQAKSQVCLVYTRLFS
jgi:hypothetical protein